ILEAALVENIQRTDLNPSEKAQGFKDYLERFGMTQEQLAHRLGLDRTTISNLVNLLDLPAKVQEAVRLGQISLGHAKLLKGLTYPDRQGSPSHESLSPRHTSRPTAALTKPPHTLKTQPPPS